MSRAERDKGARGEREVAAVFRAAGFDCDRTPNSGGLRLKADLYGNVPVHVESKWQETARVWAWIEQAEQDSDGAPWVVAFRRSRSPWYAVRPLDHEVQLLARLEAFN